MYWLDKLVLRYKHGRNPFEGDPKGTHRVYGDRTGNAGRGGGRGKVSEDRVLHARVLEMDRLLMAIIIINY